MNVSWTTFIFFAARAVSVRVTLPPCARLPDSVCVELDAPIDPLLEDDPDLGVEAGESVERAPERLPAPSYRVRQ
jgi:hypothetical protein